MSSLYDLTKEFIEVQNMIYDENYSAETIRTTLECISYEIEQKADNYAKLIKNISVDVEGLKKEIDRLQAKKQALEKKQTFLKEHLKLSMIALGIDKIKTRLFSFSVRKASKGHLIVDDIDKVPKKFLKPPEVDRKAIIEYLKESNDDVDGITIEEPVETLFIR